MGCDPTIPIVETSAVSSKQFSNMKNYIHFFFKLLLPADVSKLVTKSKFQKSKENPFIPSNLRILNLVFFTDGAGYPFVLKHTSFKITILATSLILFVWNT